MIARWHAYAQLVRLPNLVTAAADSLAGFLFVGGSLADTWTLGGLAAASICLYAGGVALNDVCDAPRDAVARPDRPIPAGRISRSRAYTLSCLLLLVGCACAFLVTPATGMTAVALTVSIVMYDALLKQSALAAPAMGLCRALNFGLGLSVSTEGVGSAQWLALAAIWLYVSSVTSFARQEAIESDRPRLRTATAGMTTATLALMGLALVLPTPSRGYLLPVAALATVVAFAGLRAVSRPTPPTVQHAVKIFVLAIVAFDACIVWSSRGVLLAAAVAALLAPAAILSRYTRVT